MKKYDKEAYGIFLKDEAKTLSELKKNYQKASKELTSKIKKLMDRKDADLPNVIHQVKYQKALKSQIEEVLDKFDGYKTIEDYIENSYYDGFFWSMYSMQKQGVPLVFPLNQMDVARALTLDTKLKNPLYKQLGLTKTKMMSAIRSEMARGISTGASYADIARNVNNKLGIGLYNSMRISRTESHRVSMVSKEDAMKRAKKAGADVVKQWDATLDGKTRPHHRELDGQIRELDEPFEVAGITTMRPGGFGIPSEDIHCRCVMLERARWAVQDEGKNDYTKFDGDAGVIKDLSDVKNVQEFKVKSCQTMLQRYQKDLLGIENKSYSGIWKDAVDVSDYPLKKGSIQAKKDYYKSHIDKGENVDTFNGYLKDLDEFEELGSKYEDIQNKIEETNAYIKRFAVETETIEDVSEAYTKERKDAAYWFKTKEDADKEMAPVSKRVWAKATEAERESVIGYTSSSGAWNRPLAGFEKPYSDYGSGWEPKYYKGVNKVWIDYEGKGDDIRRMTDLINRSEYDFDIWLQRGVDYNAVESLFEVPFGTLADVTEEELQKFVGKEGKMMNFCSCGTAKGHGFTKDIIFNIYCPKGTKMYYAEPISFFKGGKEFETIIQRGGTYSVTKIEKSKGMLYIDLEHHPEAGYDLIQQDPSEWLGSTGRNK